MNPFLLIIMILSRRTLPLSTIAPISHLVATPFHRVPYSKPSRGFTILYILSIFLRCKWVFWTYFSAKYREKGKAKAYTFSRKIGMNNSLKKHLSVSCCYNRILKAGWCITYRDLFCFIILVPGNFNMHGTVLERSSSMHHNMTEQQKGAEKCLQKAVTWEERMQEWARGRPCYDDRVTFH